MNEVAKKENYEVVVADDQWAGLGAEDASTEDFAIPFIQIAQGLSPQLEKSDAKYIKGLEKYDLFNTVTNESYKDGVRVIPVKYERKYLEFNLREEGGGLVAIHEDFDPEVLKRRDDKNRSITDDGTQIVETRSFYCMVEGEEGWYPAIVSMKSTGIKKAKQWMSMCSSVKWKKSDGTPFTAPMFARTYRLTVAPETKNDNTWGNWVIEREPEPLSLTDPEFIMAHDFYNSLSKGEVKVDYAAGHDEGSQTEDDAIEM